MKALLTYVNLQFIAVQNQQLGTEGIFIVLHILPTLTPAVKHWNCSSALLALQVMTTC